MNEFLGSVVLVMGAGSPLGRSLAVAFARRGAVIAANDISPYLLDETVRAVQSAGGDCHSFGYDAAKKMPVQALIGDIVDACGKLDVLINAGIVMPAAGILEMDEWDWHRTLDMNLAGAFFAIQVAGRVMRVQGGGTILNILLDPEPLSHMTGRSALVASQSALAALTQSAAVELGAHKIRVNAIALSVRENDPSKEGEPPAPPPGRLAYIPLAMQSTPEAAALQALELCASNLSGQIVSC